MYFVDESFNEGDIGRKFDRFYFSHKVPVMIIVAVVVTKNTSIIHGTPSQVDVSETVGNCFSIFEPDLLFQQRTFSLSLEPVYFNRLGPNGRFLLRHGAILAQIGFTASCLDEGIGK
jgi:hypothetical protein